MRKIRFALSAAFGSILAVPALAATPKIPVTIVARQASRNPYVCTIPGRTAPNPDGREASGWESPEPAVSFRAQGATFARLLPSGRIAVVNCKSKFQEKFEGPWWNRRNCRQPIVDNIEAEGVDGTKEQSETHKILAIVPRKG